MSSVIESLSKSEIRKLRFTEFAEDPESEIPNTEQYQEQVWKNLSERRKIRACVRCGWFEKCKIKEISKYHRYNIHSLFQWIPNTIDTEARKRGCDLCSMCGQELVSEQFLGMRSKRIEKLSNRPAILRKLRAIERLCNAIDILQREHQRLIPKLESLKRNKPDYLTYYQFAEMIRDAEKEVNHKAELVQRVKAKIDELVSIYSIK